MKELIENSEEQLKDIYYQIEKVEEYNQETEEYLDPEEYEMMYGEDDPKGIK